MEKPASNENSRLVSDAEGGKEGGCCAGFFRILQPCLAELIGVTLFVFVGCMSVQDEQLNNRPSAIAIAVTHGFAIALLVASFGHISGGHFNPAVTLGAALSGGIKPIVAICYVLFQLGGSIIGAGICRGALSFQIRVNFTRAQDVNFGATTLDPGVHPVCGLVIETMITLLLVLTVLMTAVDLHGRTNIAPLAIGFAVTVGILAAINDTGGSMNPARSFGPAVWAHTVDSKHKGVWADHWIYWAGPALGAALAALIYRLFFASPDRRVLFKNN
ncbi:aquaporin-8-like [Tubulanus polymorphus]|uniref:aquaporin-8-like n=1 Tax=Tubulanus polymorphus TaxID=672921 RepID=UPI003DA52F30